MSDDFGAGDNEGEAAHYLEARELDETCGVVKNIGKVIGPGHHRASQGAAASPGLVQGEAGPQPGTGGHHKPSPGRNQGDQPSPVPHIHLLWMRKPVHWINGN